MVAKNPAATTLSVLSIAFGIGFATAMFSFADAAYLRPFPFHHPEQVLQLTSFGDDGRPFLYGWPDSEDLTRAGTRIAELTTYQRRGVLLERDDELEVLTACIITPNHFAFLGVRPALGTASVDPMDGRPAIVLGDRIWRRRFGADPAITGKTVILTRHAFVVAGVMPPEFTGIERGVRNDVSATSRARSQASPKTVPPAIPRCMSHRHPTSICPSRRRPPTT